MLLLATTNFAVVFAPVPCQGPAHLSVRYCDVNYHSISAGFLILISLLMKRQTDNHSPGAMTRFPRLTDSVISNQLPKQLRLEPVSQTGHLTSSLFNIDKMLSFAISNKLNDK